MAQTNASREIIFLLLALTDSARAIEALDSIVSLSARVEQRQPSVEVRENSSIFVQLRLALHYSASVSRVFWPSDASAAARGTHLRQLAGLPSSCPIDRRLRNHIEHLDERLDRWTTVSPRPFTALECVIHDVFPHGAPRDAIIAAVAVVYETDVNKVSLFGETFDLADLRAAMESIRSSASSALSQTLL